MNIEESNKIMTVFYSVSTGKIKSIISGKQDMNIFGEDKEDYNYNFLIIYRDDYILNNSEKFKVIDKKVVLKEEFKVDIQKYI